MLSENVRKRLLSGSAWALAGQALNTVLRLVINALLARLLCPEDMGAYFLAISITTFGSILGLMGLDQTIVRFIAEPIGLGKPERSRVALRNALFVAVIGVGLVCLITIPAGRALWGGVFNTPPLARKPLLITLLILMNAFQMLTAGVLRGFHDIRGAVVFGGLLTNAFFAGALAILWTRGATASLEFAIILFVVGGFMSLVLGDALVSTHVRRLPRGSEEGTSRREIVRVGWPVFLAALATFFVGNVDLWIIGMVRTGDELALYGAAQRLVLLAALPLFIVNSVVPPFASHCIARKESKELEHILRVTATWAGLPAWAALTLFVVVGNVVLALIFGEFYAQAQPILVILCLGQVANVSAGSCGTVLIMAGYERTMMRITLSMAGLLTAGCYFAAHYVGLLGVAGVTAGVMALQNGLVIWHVRKRLGCWSFMRLPTPKNLKL